MNDYHLPKDVPMRDPECFQFQTSNSYKLEHPPLLPSGNMNGILFKGFASDFIGKLAFIFMFFFVAFSVVLAPGLFGMAFWIGIMGDFFGGN